MKLFEHFRAWRRPWQIFTALFTLVIIAALTLRFFALHSATLLLKNSEYKCLGTRCVYQFELENQGSSSQSGYVRVQAYAKNTLNQEKRLQKARHDFKINAHENLTVKGELDTDQSAQSLRFILATE